MHVNDWPKMSNMVHRPNLGNGSIFFSTMVHLAEAYSFAPTMVQKKDSYTQHYVNELFPKYLFQSIHIDGAKLLFSFFNVHLFSLSLCFFFFSFLFFVGSFSLFSLIFSLSLHHRGFGGGGGD